MSSSLTAEVKSVLRSRSANTLIITAGNSFRKDDGVGPYVAAQLKSTEGLNLIDAGFTPEDIVEEAIAFKPDTMVVIDAADFRGDAGEARVIPEGEIPETTLSTHMIPLSIVTKIISDTTQSKTIFIGIQAKDVGFGDQLSGEIKATADQIIEELKINPFAKGKNHA